MGNLLDKDKQEKECTKPFLYSVKHYLYVPVGSLPGMTDGIVNVPACASFLDETCTRKYSIPIKNCGTFNVYCLFPVIDAFDRFCMGMNPMTNCFLTFYKTVFYDGRNVTYSTYSLQIGFK